MRTVMIAFDFGGDASIYSDIGESALGAFHVWQTLGWKYKILSPESSPRYDVHVPKIKRLVETDLLTDEEYYVLQTTFDNKIIPSTMYKTVAKALRIFHPTTANLLRQSLMLHIAARRNIRAVSIVQFMMGDNLWYNHEKSCPYNLDHDDWHSVLVERRRSL